MKENVSKINKNRLQIISIISISVIFVIIIQMNTIIDSISLCYGQNKKSQNRINQIYDQMPTYEIRYLNNKKKAVFDITVITQLFHFEKSKHTDEEYKKWSKTLVASVADSPIVAYVDYFWADQFVDTCNQFNLSGLS